MLGSTSHLSPLSCSSSADLSQQAYSNAPYTASAATYNPYASADYMNAAKAVTVATRPTPYSRNMDYPTYHPRMNGLYQRSTPLGTYGYEAR